MLRKLFVLLFLSAVGLYAQNESNFKSSSNSLNSLSSAMSVTIGGSFIVTGTFPSVPGERVDQFVSRIFNEAKAEKLAIAKEYEEKKELVVEFEKIANRNIKLKRKNGSEIIIDLEKFRLTGDFANNPYLMHEDVLIFPDYDPIIGFVTIGGAVNKHTIFQYVAGDKFSDALMFAHGINPAYENVNEFKIVRLSYDGSKEEVQNYKITENPDLKIGDRIVVLAEETGRKDYKVIIKGEVNMPGEIPVSKSSTTLYELVKKAGGFTANADLNRAELIRGANVFKSPVFSEEFERLMMQRMADISVEDSVSFITDNKLRFARGNAVLDFTKLSDPNSVESNFIVKDWDYIFIPEKVELVYVFGQVQYPGYINYSADKSVDYYINLAGGVGKTAKEEIYLVKGKSRGWKLIEEDTKYTIEPGDFIWIPKEMPRTFDYYLSRITAISAVIGAVATIALLIVQLGK